MKNELRFKGISLIVLVITIIVIIILATAIILTLVKNNPIEEANKARYESDRDSMQAIFTNTVAKIMAKNQGSIDIKAGQINSVKSGVNSTTGEVIYKLENPEKSENKEGKIIFENGTNTEVEYYIGRKLPIYSAGETIWSVDKEGILSLKVGKNQSSSDSNNDNNQGGADEESIEKLREEYAELLKRVEELEKKDNTQQIQNDPIGTILSYMGNKVPEGYLSCDGKIYNIVDYPNLSKQFKEQFGKSNYFGGNGTTTFAVPDLRGEFLRGAGTNGHSNQGSGLTAGKHQDATEIPYIFSAPDTKEIATYTNGNNREYSINWDSAVTNSTQALITSGYTTIQTWTRNMPQRFSARPTNTSVLYCIKF